MTAYDDRAKAQTGRVLNTIAGGGKGQAVTLTRSSPGSYSAGAVTLTTTTQTGSGVQVEYSSHAIDGTMIRQGDKKFLLSPLNSAGTTLTAPEPKIDTLTLADASVWTIEDVLPLSPAGTVIYYELQLRAT